MMNTVIPRLAALFGLLALAACATPKVEPQPQVVPGYEGIQDGEYFIEPVAAHHLTGNVPRQEVDFTGDEPAGSIVVDPYVRKLYYVLPGGRAMRYTVAVGRAGLGFRGNATVNRKVEWPSWTPTANMIRTQPELYADYAGGLPGGLINPLGARALYLYRNGKDTFYRIHGTRENSSIGRATSAGCIRLFNQDAIDLFNRVDLGTRVHVRGREESERLEGKWMDDENGHLIPYDAAMIAEIEARREAIEAQKAADEAAAAATAAAAAEAGTTTQG